MGDMTVRAGGDPGTQDNAPLRFVCEGLAETVAHQSLELLLRKTDFGEALNPPSVIFAGQVVGRIGLATAKPAEFIVLRFSQDTRALEAELAGAA